METYTEEEFWGWFDAQPGNTPVDMGNGHYNPDSRGECGCVLIQFFESKGFIGGKAHINGTYQGFSGSIIAKVVLTTEYIFTYFKRESHAAQTFGELKKDLDFFPSKG